VAQRPVAVSADVASIVQAMFTSGVLTSALERVVAAVHASIGAADAVSVTLTMPQRRTAASSDRFATEGDRLQFAIGQGPMLHALDTSSTVNVQDMATETRWGYYRPFAIDLGVRSALVVPVGGDDRPAAALSLYSRRCGVFDDAVTEAAHADATFVAVMVANAVLYDAAPGETAHEDSTRAAREAVAAGTDRLVSIHGCSEDEALVELVQQSHRSGTKLPELAAAI